MSERMHKDIIKRIEEVEALVSLYAETGMILSNKISELEQKLSNLKLSVDDNNTWIIDNDNLKERIKALEKIILDRHKLGVKGEYYFSNKQIAIEKNEKEIAELKEKIRTHGHHPLTISSWEQFQNMWWSWQNSFQTQINSNREVLRELIKIDVEGIKDFSGDLIYTPSHVIKQACKPLLEKLDGSKVLTPHRGTKDLNILDLAKEIRDDEKPSAIVGDLDPKETLGFEDWQIELLEKLREWFPQAQRESLQPHKEYIENDLKLECPQCGWISERFKVLYDTKDKILVAREELVKWFGWMSEPYFNDKMIDERNKDKEKYLSEEYDD